LSLLFGLGVSSGAQENQTVLSLSEAKTLVFVSPIAEDLRRRGTDIGIELQTSSKLKQTDYYYFWVYNTKRTHSGGSVTIGYYAVSKHTADLWDVVTGKRVSGKLLEDIQTILREAHGIVESTVKRYRSTPP